jgi:hypothetical protein
VDPFASRDLDEIVAEIGRRIAGVSHPLVAVDGMLGAGKTPLAEQAAPRLGLSCLDFDDYVLPQHARRGLGYVAALRLNNLRRDIDDAPAGVILAGACMRDVLAQLRREATIHVYVKRWNTLRDCWEDEDSCGEEALDLITPGLRDSRGAAIEYHMRRHPEQHSAIEWRRVGDDPPRAQ